ncbi:hypothetical protein NHQ30_009104 [Ciborinia camelliae]|nr:hypothetical protein NHQ30_009104 [Ciborinia camelliae]
MSVSQTHEEGDASGYRPFVKCPLLKGGVYVPTVAFFDPDSEEVDVKKVAQHATNLAASGIAGLVTQGSNGEAVHLMHDERSLVTSTTREALDKAGQESMPVIVGCGAESVRESVKFCKDAKDSGGNYALILPPSYYSPLLNRQLILGFFKQIADESPIPIIIYNFPAVVECDLNSDEILELSAYDNIAGVKLTCGNNGKLSRIAAGADPSFFFAGDSADHPSFFDAGGSAEHPSFFVAGGSADFILPTMSVGGSGVIAGLANLAPRACVRLMKLIKEGKTEKAKKLQATIAKGDWVAIQGGFVSVKVGLQHYYGYGGPPRKPCALPEEKEREKIIEGFKELLDFEEELKGSPLKQA